MLILKKEVKPFLNYVKPISFPFLVSVSKYKALTQVAANSTVIGYLWVSFFSGY